ncbi:MAG: PD-(D/E)XK nuclease family protein [Patescibacteria group bacterium]|nr:PD-(D/E)XK nuclease family protein [Patescibacteria group bacterium]
MPKDKYTAVWVSHSSINDFLNCPRAYYYNHIYRDPNTGHKIQLMSPPLALGQIVHEVLESLSVLPVKDRFKKSLIERFNQTWKKVSGEKGGFFNESTEKHYKERGEEILRRVMRHPGPIEELAVKIQQDLPYYWLSEEEEIILCGKIDWLQYLPDEDAVHIIDFKTGKKRENENSLQLPIYHLLVHNVQKRKVVKASYWYLQTDDKLTEKELPDLEEAHKEVLQVAKKIKLARKLEHFKCPQGEGGCPFCRPFAMIVAGKGKKVGTNDYKQDVYVLNQEDKKEAVVL